MGISNGTLDGINAIFAQPNAAVSVSNIAEGLANDQAATLSLVADLADAGASLVAKSTPLTGATAFGLGAWANLDKAKQEFAQTGSVSVRTTLEAASNLVGLAGSVLAGAAVATANPSEESSPWSCRVKWVRRLASEVVTPFLLDDCQSTLNGREVEINQRH